MSVIYFYAQARLVADDAYSCGLAVVLYDTWNCQNDGNNRRVMLPTMWKPLTVTFKRFATRFTDLYNYLLLFLGSTESNNMDEAELKNILLHTVPN